MKDEGKSEVTQMLQMVSEGKERAADRLLPLVYNELRGIAGTYMRRERSDHTLQPTSLVHEAYVKLVDQDQIDWKGKTHFLAVSANAMRRILVDHARTKMRKKRGGDKKKVGIEVAEWSVLDPQDEDHVLAVDEALEMLETLDERQARIVEMRFFTGMTVKEVAEAMGVSKRTIEAEWTMIKAWLKKEIKL